MIKNSWPEPFHNAATHGLPPFDRDLSIRRTVTTRWLVYVPDGVPCAETVSRFVDHLSRQIKAHTLRRYLTSLRDVLTMLFPGVALGHALPKRADRVFPTCPIDNWPVPVTLDLARARKILKHRVWQSSKEVAAKYLAMDAVSWPPDAQSLKLFRQHILRRRKASTAYAYMSILHRLLAAAYPTKDFTWMIEAYRDLGRREIRPRRTGQYTRRIAGLPVNQWPDDWKHAWLAFVERTNSDALTTSDDAFRDGVALLRALEATRPSGETQSGSYASATLETWRYAVGQYFGVLKKLGHSLILDRMAVGIWADVERPYIEPITFATRLAAILQAAQRLFPQQEWEWLVDLVRAGYSVAPGKGAWSPRHADRLVGAGRLRHAALAALRTVRRKPPTLRTAVEFRDALVILLLTYEPLRRKDLANLPLTAMEWREDGSVSIESSTSKNNQDVATVFRGDLAEHLVLWVRRYRSILLAGVAREAATILVGQGGAPLTAGNLTRLVRAWTAKHLGQPLSPHDVRGAVAYTVVMQAGDVLAASRLLHNRDSRIVERHYSGAAGQVRASEALDRAVEGDICNPSFPTDKR